MMNNDDSSRRRCEISTGSLLETGNVGLTVVDRPNMVWRNVQVLFVINCAGCLSQWPSGLRRGSAADRLLGLRVRIPAVGMDVCVVSVVQ